ncbi:glycosyl hydrolase 115 family protein [Mariniflexile gromovii]|uniref:Glycosyl hydrolase 115 family protein n=1 Tax=Mariniflexile gromovii TaxID=362523 RepID=A0ABS4BTQ7_9FLAO|nr:glycosyl hydrolase 115 family protein [Mariniflexile gromovii]MBP0903978.1 glycosyl hydrolase 115 family protein [Mariniflexile gromovii]
MPIFFKNQFYLLSFIIAFPLLFSCSNEAIENYYLVIGSSVTNVELSTVNDLKNDLSKVLDGKIQIISESNQLKLKEKGAFFILGTPQTSGLIKDLSIDNQIKLSSNIPGARGGIWSKTILPNGQNAIIIGGSDIEGLQYAIYDYSKDILGVDPLEYWTGKLPIKKTMEDLFSFTSKTISPPKVPMLTYFENDVDELANYRGKLLEYDWESYTELINSLVRLRYNSIQLFDMLGRPEFFIRPEYKALKPDYQIDINYVDKMIDYAHEKGMKVAVDFALGYQIHPMEAEKADCWKQYKEDWLQAWRYYFEKTPLAKTDIFILRPRHQVWDWEYESTCGESKIEVFNEVYEAFGNLVDEYKPNVQKVLVCYSDGMEMWNEGFRPPTDWTVLWSDHGFGDFEHLPNTTDGYKFGTYMHAGYWSNHTVHNPYPEKVETVMKEMFQTYGADNYCLVNGQNFRPFLLNLEAYSEVCNNPETFNGNAFYKSWTERYFSKEAAQHAVSSMKWLHKAQEGRKGYVEHLWEIREAVSYLSNAPIRRPGKTPIPFDYKRVEGDLENTAHCKNYLQKSLEEAQKGYQLTQEKDNFYHAYILLPVVLYSDLIAFETTLHNMSVLKKEFEDTKSHEALEKAKALIPEAKQKLQVVYQNRASGDIDEKWKNWYSIKIRRQNNGFPTPDMLEDIEANLNKMTL